jgi:hypothetical protein
LLILDFLQIWILMEEFVKQWNKNIRQTNLAIEIS